MLVCSLREQAEGGDGPGGLQPEQPVSGRIPGPVPLRQLDQPPALDRLLVPGQTAGRQTVPAALQEPRDVGRGGLARGVSREMAGAADVRASGVRGVRCQDL